MRLGDSFATITSRAVFKNIYQQGLHVATKGLVLQVLPYDTSSKLYTIGFTASKKVGNAVARNRTKRRLRALIQQYLPKHAIPAHYVIIARIHTKDRSFDDLRGDLIYALNKLKYHK